MFSNLNKSARPDAPSRCFDQFLEFHNQIAQAIAEMASIQAASEVAQAPTVESKENGENCSEEKTPILHEIMHNVDQSRNSESTASKRRAALNKSSAVVPERSDQKSILGKHLR